MKYFVVVVVVVVVEKILNSSSKNQLKFSEIALEISNKFECLEINLNYIQYS
jgi:hypothetical protein